MLYGSIRRNLYARLAIHKMRWTPVFDYLFTPISTPKWHETIWFCMKFYKLAISKNLVTMRFYGLLLRYIDLWKKANLQQYLISFLSLPVQKPYNFAVFCLSLYFLYALFTPFLFNWRRSLLKLTYCIYQWLIRNMNISVHCCFYTCVPWKLLQHFRLYATFNRACSISMS